MRVGAEPEFGYISEDLAKTKKRILENRISLNEKLRRAEIEEDKAIKEKRKTARAGVKPSSQKVYNVTLDNVSKPELELVKDEKMTAVNVSKQGAELAKDDKKTVVKEPVDPKKDVAKSDASDGDDVDEDEDELGGKKAGVDPVKAETLNILGDLIDLTRTAPKKETASTQAAK